MHKRRDQSGYVQRRDTVPENTEPLEERPVGALYKRQPDGRCIQLGAHHLRTLGLRVATDQGD